MTDGDNQDEEATWRLLYNQIRRLLTRFGSEDIERTADCWVDDDNLGHRQQKIYIRNLELLRPHVITALQTLLAEFPSWEIMVAVSVPGPGDAWPDMGLTIRAHEIIDGLQRRYFPKEYQGIEYEGSRPGTERD